MTNVDDAEFASSGGEAIVEVCMKLFVENFMEEQSSA